MLTSESRSFFFCHGKNVKVRNSMREIRHQQHMGQEKHFEIQMLSGPVHFSFQLPKLKYSLPNRRAMFCLINYII